MLAAGGVGNPVGEANSDEALQKHDSDRRSQEPVLAPRRRVRAYQAVVYCGLVKTGGLARREVVQRRLIGRRLKRSHSSLDGLEVQQRRFCFWCVLVCRAHFEVHGLRAKVVRAQSQVRERTAPVTTPSDRSIGVVGQHP